eukprot:5294490-Prymnesium_polylepis.1
MSVFRRRCGLVALMCVATPAFGALANFSKAVPYILEGKDGKIWIEHTSADGEVTPSGGRRELVFKGANWAGFQEHGCPHELGKHAVQDYVNLLRDNRFNAVRMPLSVPRIVHGENPELANAH